MSFFTSLSGLKNAQTDLQVIAHNIANAETAPTKRHDPSHPLADANGDVFEAPVDETAEMVEIMDASRQYQNLVQALQTAKQLMLETLRSQ